MSVHRSTLLVVRKEYRTVFNRDPNQPSQGGQTGRPSPFGFPATSGVGYGGVAAPATAAVRQGFLRASFTWMFMALIVSAGTALFVFANPQALRFVAQNYFFLAIGAFVVSLVIQMGINRIGTMGAVAGLSIYAVLMGATIGAIVAAYVTFGGAAAVVSAFLGASAIFGGAALYGVVTKRDLTKLGGLLFMAFLGLFVVMLVNMFMNSSGLSFVIGIAGVLIFTGLTAYFVQQLNNGGLDYIANRDSAAVVGALLLYISFINLFLFLLSLFGGNRD
ncbi:MAG: Bax inhibitor-1/YccA family protein [Chloroflexi bacterium]|nr:Bax inhibitor-1/YccA family protein [Chloroflexota bacterium]